MRIELLEKRRNITLAGMYDFRSKVLRVSVQ